jgi:hypothetical protein
MQIVQLVQKKKERNAYVMKIIKDQEMIVYLVKQMPLLNAVVHQDMVEMIVHLPMEMASFFP